MKVVVIDYQLGNIYSIINMLKRIGVEAICSNSASEIANADKLILPGVGAFDHGMKNLNESNLLKILNMEVLENKKPILGICLGMQLLLERSEEGKEQGLGWIPGHCVRFNFKESHQHLKIPHMGWNVIKSKVNNHFFNDGIDKETRFYFVHSYHGVCSNKNDVIATSQHGYEFPALVGRGNILGVQFHPEKSHKYGMQLLKNFIELKN